MDASARASKAFRGFAREGADMGAGPKFFRSGRKACRDVLLRPDVRCGEGNDGSARSPARIPARVAAGAKRKGPGDAGALSLIRFRVRLGRRRFACRRRPEISKTNPFQISCWHCPYGTVNGAYTLISKVNRVLTIFITANLAVMRCGSAGRRRESRRVRKTIGVFQGDSLDRHRSPGWRAAPWFRRPQCLRRPRRRRGGARDRSSI